MTDSRISPKQQAFVIAYVGEAHYNASEAARIAGYAHARVQGPRLLENVAIKAAIDDHLAEIRKRGIALRQNRIDGLVERHRLLDQIIKERAADPFVADVPGGTTGLIVKQLKKVKYVYLPDPDDEDGKASVEIEDIYVAAVDVGMLKEMRETEKQVAQEMGEWTEKSEVVNSGSLIVQFGERPDGPA